MMSGGEAQSSTIRTSSCYSFSNDACLQRNYQTLDILFIYKGKAIIVEESKWFIDT